MKTQSRFQPLVKILPWLGVIALIYGLLLAVNLLSSGFQTGVGDQAKDLFQFATNPLAGLLVGMLATTLIQSSSTVTSIIVSLVAGGLPVALAIPMVMGSNIGTTLTNTVVSLGHIRKGEEFSRAFAAATVHDCFNVCCVLIFLPLEMTTHFLESLAELISGQWLKLLTWQGGEFNLITTLTQPPIQLIMQLTEPLAHPWDGVVMVGLGVSLIFVAIFYLGKLLKQLLVGTAKQILQTALGKSAIAGLFSGTIITLLVQSSSTTTSLIIPLAGTNLVSLEQVYPFTLGANIGTCLTALIAAFAVPDHPVVALQIAIVHLLYNSLGVLVIYTLPGLRQVPLYGARGLADLATQQKGWVVVYLLGGFFLIPGLLLGLTSHGFLR
ncbi:Na/Pi symporter [Spirulina sp. CS-785/01]|uniref:Na/Pi symporter n=1 Tax=Spirulina sp. CS-785/01 TaxID=3021716 RepID=UPI00232EC91F|nr:Na/Pi symporter [Spirulina sp. CS-785/01]MDB9311503.1 Na/Pi symporter [Spirulina sp. CS-785/01]